MKKLLTISLLLLSSCAQSSGVMKLGLDTYNISVHAAPARGGESGAQKIALTDANIYCESIGKEIQVTSIGTHPSSHFPGGTAEVTFQCLNKNETHRPNLVSTPDIIIENRH